MGKPKKKKMSIEEKVLKKYKLKDADEIRLVKELPGAIREEGMPKYIFEDNLMMFALVGRSDDFVDACREIAEELYGE